MSEINETIKRAGEGAQRITNDALAYESDGCPKLAAILRTEAVAIRFLIALHTPKDGAAEEYKQQYRRAVKEFSGSNESMFSTGYAYGVIVGKRLTEIAAKQEQGKE